MSKRGKSKKKTATTKGSERREGPRESRRAEVITVGWMLSVFATLLATIVAGLTAMVVHWAGEDAPPIARMLPELLLLIASTAGMAGLLLIYPTYRIRQVAPPKSVTLFAVAVCLAPWLLILALSFRGGH